MTIQSLCFLPLHHATPFKLFFYFSFLQDMTQLHMSFFSTILHVSPLWVSLSLHDSALSFVSTLPHYKVQLHVCTIAHYRYSPLSPFTSNMMQPLLRFSLPLSLSLSICVFFTVVLCFILVFFEFKTINQIHLWCNSCLVWELCTS